MQEIVNFPAALFCKFKKKSCMITCHLFGCDPKLTFTNLVFILVNKLDGSWRPKMSLLARRKVLDKPGRERSCNPKGWVP